MSQDGIDEMDENDARICKNLKIDTSSSKFTDTHDTHDTSMLTNVCDLIYESIKELEMNIKD
jgi:hypothetical protein